jgi:hypothetical protein
MAVFRGQPHMRKARAADYHRAEFSNLRIYAIRCHLVYPLNVNPDSYLITGPDDRSRLTGAYLSNI